MTDLRIDKAKDAVIRAAVRWVEVEDDGTVTGLDRITRAIDSLERAVSRYQAVVRIAKKGAENA